MLVILIRRRSGYFTGRDNNAVDFESELGDFVLHDGDLPFNGVAFTSFAAVDS